MAIGAGLAAIFAESISIAIEVNTSTKADTARNERERIREYRHIHLVPSLEKEEVHEVYQTKGFESDSDKSQLLIY